MIHTGFLKVAAAIPEVKVADCEFNVRQIKKLILEANQQGIEIICFPELSLTAYTCGDLFLQKILIDATEKELRRLLHETTDIPICFIVGAPVKFCSKLYNCAIVCKGGRIYGIVPKVFFPNYFEFPENRWFESIALNNTVVTIDYAGESVPFGKNLLFNCCTAQFAVEICEEDSPAISPGSYHAVAGAQVIFNLAASSELIGKHTNLKSLISQQSAQCKAAYVYASAGFGESTTDSVYAGNAFIYENGHLLAESERFLFNEQWIASEIDLDLLEAERGRNATFRDQLSGMDYMRIHIPEDIMPDQSNQKSNALSRQFSRTPFVPPEDYCKEGCDEIFSIQVAGLTKRLFHTGAKTLLVGVSGGLDSTLALLVCIKTVDKSGLPRSMVCGVTMPGFGTTNRTYMNANRLMQSLGITAMEIPIADACEQHFKDIGHDFSIKDITYENAQARERTQILMDLANQQQGLVIGTGDMSESALGWMTFNGDHISMYNVNAGIPKTLIRHLVKRVAETQLSESNKIVLEDILNTPISPELLPVDSQGRMTQLTEDLIGPYELNDFFLFYTLRYGFTPSKIYFLAQQAFRNIYDDSTILSRLEIFFRRFFSQQFKRNCMSDGPKVGPVNLSPRSDWRMPSDACANVWLKEIEELRKK